MGHGNMGILGFSVGKNAYGNIYSRTAIMAIVGGSTSTLTGGKFANGAMSGTFIYLYNELGSMIINKKNHVTSAVGLDPKLGKNPFDFGAGFGGGLHLGIVGVNAHYDGLNETCNICVRIGPGAYIGGGVEYYGYATYGEESNDFYYTGGVGADVMLGDVGTGGGINGNFDTIAGTGGTRYGMGLGGSIGLDLCVNW